MKKETPMPNLHGVLLFYPTLLKPFSGLPNSLISVLRKSHAVWEKSPCQCNGGLPPKFGHIIWAKIYDFKLPLQNYNSLKSISSSIRIHKDTYRPLYSEYSHFPVRSQYSYVLSQVQIQGIKVLERNIFRCHSPRWGAYTHNRKPSFLFFE